MTAYQLLAFLQHLTLVGQEDGELQWVGTKQQWNEASRLVDYYETYII